MKENETFYGDFTEPKENKTSKRGESVVLTAIDRCQQLESELERACQMIGKLNLKVKELEDFIELLRGE